MENDVTVLAIAFDKQMMSESCSAKHTDRIHATAKPIKWTDDITVASHTHIHIGVYVQRYVTQNCFTEMPNICL